MRWPRTLAAQVIDVLTGSAAGGGIVCLASGSLRAALVCAVAAGVGLALMNLRAFRKE